MDIDAISAMVDAGRLTPRKAQIVASGLGLDASAIRVPCAGDACNKSITIGESVSYVIVQATTGTTGLPAFQCEDEQHYGCSAACAMQAAMRCMREHLAPRLVLRERE